MLKKVATTILCVTGSVLIIFALVVACVEIFAFNNDFYKKEYTKLKTAQVVGVSEETLFMATDKLLDYLKDKEANLDMSVDGEEYYNDREKAHMADVKTLYQNAKSFMALGFILGTLLIISNFVILKKNGLKTFVKSFFYTGCAILLFFGIITMYAILDFSSFWVNFHLVFFTNDLWMFDPATSLLIRMYEQTFFFDLVGSILALFFIIFGTAMAVCGVYIYKVLNKGKKHERY